MGDFVDCIVPTVLLGYLRRKNGLRMGDLVINMLLAEPEGRKNFLTYRRR
jgi:hypothetical protein